MSSTEAPDEPRYATDESATIWAGSEIIADPRRNDVYQVAVTDELNRLLDVIIALREEKAALRYAAELAVASARLASAIGQT